MKSLFCSYTSQPFMRLWAMVWIALFWHGVASAQCSQPSNLSAVNLTPTSVSLSWSAIQGAFSYTVQYRVNGTTTWTTVTGITGTSTVLSALAESTVYQWRVKASCSTYSSVATFNTGGSGNNTACSQPSNLMAVNLTPTSVALNWSAIQDAFSYTVQYRVNGTTTWTTVTGITGTSVELTGLAESTVYQWRVKASCSTYSSVATFNTGGSGNNTACSQPSNLMAVNLTPTSVTLSWSAIQEAFSYAVQYRVNGTTTWTLVSAITGTSTVLTGLAENTTYQWRVKASCSTYSSIATFLTGGTNVGGGNGGTSCSAPSNTNTLSVGLSSATVEWEPVGEAVDYTVEVRLFTASSYDVVGTVTQPGITITGLQPGMEYVWRVKASCSPFGSDVQFSTPMALMSGGQGESQNIQAQTNDAWKPDFEMYPNPVREGQLFISTAEAGGILEIYDAFGRVLIRENITGSQQMIRLQGLSNGIYYARIIAGGGQSPVRKVIISN